MTLKIGKVLHGTFVLVMLCFAIYFCIESIRGWNESPVSVTSKQKCFLGFQWARSFIGNYFFERFQLTKLIMIRLLFLRCLYAIHYLGLGQALLHTCIALTLMGLWLVKQWAKILLISWAATYKRNNVKIYKIVHQRVGNIMTFSWPSPR